MTGILCNDVRSKLNPTRVARILDPASEAEVVAALEEAPMIGDVEAFTLVDAEGEVRRCSRGENAELFRLVIGAYGCFGVITLVGKCERADFRWESCSVRGTSRVSVASRRCWRRKGFWVRSLKHMS